MGLEGGVTWRMDRGFIGSVVLQSEIDLRAEKHGAEENGGGTAAAAKTLTGSPTIIEKKRFVLQQGTGEF